MCIHNDNRKAEMQKQIDKFELEKEKYESLKTDIEAGREEVKCYSEKLKAFKEACSQVSASGSYDNGESETYIEKFNSMDTELEAQKKATANAIQGLIDSIRSLRRDIRNMDSDCADCKAKAEAAAASSYSSIPQYKLNGGR